MLSSFGLTAETTRLHFTTVVKKSSSLDHISLLPSIILSWTLVGRHIGDSSKIILNVTWMKTQCKINQGPETIQFPSPDLFWERLRQLAAPEDSDDCWSFFPPLMFHFWLTSTGFYFFLSRRPLQACHAPSKAAFEEEVGLGLCR